MLRTPLIAALSVALMAGTALAQPATRAPADMSNSARDAPSYDDDDDYAPPTASARTAQGAQVSQADRDMFCRRDAAARTGYTTPGEAAHDEQTRGTVIGTLGGAALGAVLGGAAGNAGLGAAAGAGAGLIAGTAVGSDNARHAAEDVRAAYGDAYYACMHEDGQRTAAGYGYDAPPPPAPGYGYGYPPPYSYGGFYGSYGGFYGPGYYGPGYYPGYYYGPSVSFGFGFGGGHGWHGGGFRHR